MPFDLLGELPIRDFERGDSARLNALKSSIRTKGWQPLRPIIVRIGRKGRWVVVDGGHRLTALLLLRGGWLGWLIGPRVGLVHFVLFLTPDSRSDIGGPLARVALPTVAEAELREVQGAWEEQR
ncbi:MAG: ParB/RepB/Spo0J family partition protein [Pseudomonadota bacterium]